MAAEVVRAIENLDDDALAAVMTSLCDRCLDRLSAFANDELQERDPIHVSNAFESFDAMMNAQSLRGAA